MNNTSITYQGVIQFDPVDYTKKHKTQASWKRIAMVMFDGELAEYYAWFVKKRYDIVLNKPLRGAHISFINDSVNDMKAGLGIESDNEVDAIWNTVKDKYHGKSIEISLNVDVRADKKHWWMNVDDEYRQELQLIRNELGLGKLFYGEHLSIGYCNEKYIEHSNYILGLINKFGKEYN